MRRTLLCLGFIALAPILAEAQDAPDRVVTLPLQFQFTPPGARAVGMGAAFIAIADDATASQSNPAGLVILTKPEISGHLRLSRFDTEFPNPFTDPVTTQTFSERVTSPSFFSFVYPMKNAAVSAYYQQATSFKSSAAFSIQDELFPGTPASIGVSADSDLLLEHIGASVAFKLGQNVSLGVSVRTSQLKLDNSDVFTYSDVDGDRYTSSSIIDDSNRQVTFNGGILINPNGKVSAGGFFNQGGTYDLTRIDTEDSSGPFFGNILDSGPDSSPVRLEVPDYGGGGIAFRPNDRWILSADVVFVGYSALSPSAEELDDDLENDIPVLERVEDGVQFHFGTEYTFMSGSMPVSVRAGVYNDPDHDALRRVDSDQIFGTFGAGFVIGGNFQIDFAANLSKRVKETLISAVWRF